MIDTLVRAYRGTVRSPVRTLLVVVLLAVGLGFALTSLALAFAAGDELDKIKQTTGVQAGVSIAPQQFQNAIQKELDRAVTTGEAFDSSNVGRAIEPLNIEHAEEIAALPYVRRVEVFTLAAVEYEIPGRDAARAENDFRTPIGNISLPDAVLTGSAEGAFLADFQSGAKRLEEGRLFGPEDADKDVIVIDQNTATLEDLDPGDKIALRAQTLTEEGEEPPPEPQFRDLEAEVIGVYADLEAAATTAQAGFSPARIEAWYAPINAVRKLQDPENHDLISGISIVLDSVDSVAALKADTEETLDSNLYTLTTTDKQFNDISDPVETMRNTSFLGTVAALLVVGLIMVLLMALVVRGRLREIGILKAVGARNRQVILQFAAETVGIAVVAVVLAVPIGLASNSLVADVLRPAADVKAPAVNQQSGPDLGAGARALTAAPIIDDPVRTEDVEEALGEVDASLGSEIIGLAVVIAVGLGLLGALVPIVAVLRLRPAEVLRLEA